jgi:hypothetical protein
MAVAAAAALSAKSVVESVNSLGYICRPQAEIESMSRGSESGISITQATSNATAVSLTTNFPQGLKSGQIVIFATDVAAGATAAAFTFTNAAIASTSIVRVGILSNTWAANAIPSVDVRSVSSGSCDLRVGNGGSAAAQNGGAVGALTIWFEVI